MKRCRCTSAHYNDCSRSQAKLRFSRTPRPLPARPAWSIFAFIFSIAVRSVWWLRLPLRFVFSFGNVLGFFAGVAAKLSAAREPECGDRVWPGKNHCVRNTADRSPAFSTARRQFLSGIKLNAMPLSKVVPLVAIEGAEMVHQELRAGRPVVLALSHLGNWELLAQILPQYFDTPE